MADSVRSFLIRFLGDASGLKKSTDDADRATGSFSDRLGVVRSKMADADGITGKFKAGLGGLQSQFGSAAGAAAIGAAGVAAVGVVAVKAVTAFKDLGLSVGKFRDATGMSAESSSRFIEVFGDLGIGADKAAGAMGKFAKTLGGNADAFSKYGVEIVKAKDGTMDAEATFVKAIDALNKMKDPAQRAAAAQAMFGKSWQDMSEVIAGGAPALQAALESVQPSKVLGDKDVEAARNVRDAFDGLMDAGEGLLLTLGKSLAPVVAEAASKMSKMAEAVAPLAEAVGGLLATAFKLVTPIIDAAVAAVGPLIDVLSGVANVVGGVVDAIGGWMTSDFDVGRFVAQASGELARNAEAQRYTAMAAQENAKATSEAARAAKDQADATDRARQAMQEKLSAERAAIDSSFAVADAQDRLKEAIANQTAVAADATKTQDEKARAERDAERAALALADAQQRLAEDQAKANDMALDGNAKQALLVQSLQRTAASLDAGSPLRKAIEGHIATLGSVQPTVNTNVSADTKTAKMSVEELERLLNKIDNRHVSVFVNDNLDGVMSRVSRTINALDSLQRKYTQIGV